MAKTPKTPPADKVGRPPKLTPEVHAAVVQALVNGLSRAHAATVGGITYQTFNAYRRKGKRGEGGVAYLNFFRDTDRAMMTPVTANLIKLQTAGRGGDVVQRTTTTKPDGTVVVTERKAPPNVNALTWWLERLHPGEYSGDRRELAELRRLVNQMIAEKGGTDAVRKDATETSPRPSVEHDASGDGPA